MWSTGWGGGRHALPSKVVVAMVVGGGKHKILSKVAVDANCLAIGQK